MHDNFDETREVDTRHVESTADDGFEDMTDDFEDMDVVAEEPFTVAAADEDAFKETEEEPTETEEDSEYDPEVVVEDSGDFQNEIVIYQTSDGSVALNVPLENETVWLTQSQMKELFGRDISGISRHISNVFKDGEVEKEGNVHYVRSERTGKPIAYYSLDVIISVGYRVKSKQAVEFRKWASKVLKEYILKGYAANEQRMKQLGEVIQIMKRAEKAEARGDILSALRLADEALACPGFEHDINALQFRATAGEGLSKNRLRRIIPLSGTGLLPLGGISAVTGENQSGAGWKEIGKDQIDIDNTISTYVGRETVTEDGRYRLVPTIELWAHYTDTGWENDIQVDYVHYPGAIVEEVSSGRILREYYRLYSYKSSTWNYYDTKEYESVLHSSDDGLWLLTRGDGLDLRRADGEDTRLHIADGQFQFAAFLKDYRFILTQRTDGNVEVYGLTGGEERIIYKFTGNEVGRVRYINDNCFSIAVDNSELICWLDWEYEGEKVTRFAMWAGGQRAPIHEIKAPLSRAKLSVLLPDAVSPDLDLSKYSGDGNRAADNLLHKVSDRLAVQEKEGEGAHREGLFVNLEENRVISSLEWEYYEEYNFDPAGAFFLTVDGKYLVWLTQDQKPYLVRNGDKWGCQYPYTVTARIWDAKTGRLLGDSHPIMEIYDTAYDRSRAWRQNRFMRLLQAIREHPEALVVKCPDLC